MGTHNYYADLQVVESADPDVIHAAFRALVKRYHPDAPGGSLQRMAAINQAWSVLGDPDRRAAYDARAAQHVAAKAEPTAAEETTGPLGPLARRRETDLSPTLDFGRYAGWSVDMVARHEPDYLRWLSRTPAGRAWRSAIDHALPDRAKSA